MPSLVKLSISEGAGKQAGLLCHARPGQSRAISLVRLAETHEGELMGEVGEDLESEGEGKMLFLPVGLTDCACAPKGVTAGQGAIGNDSRSEPHIHKISRLIHSPTNAQESTIQQGE